MSHGHSWKVSNSHINGTKQTVFLMVFALFLYAVFDHVLRTSIPNALYICCFMMEYHTTDSILLCMCMFYLLQVNMLISVTKSSFYTLASWIQLSWENT